jgi:tetratricopeptide (TPR) repeat protein
LDVLQNKIPRNKEMEAYLLFRIGRIDLMQGNNTIAEQRILNSIELYTELGLTSRLAHAASYLGILYINQNRYMDAENILLPILEQARQTNDIKAIARIQNVVGQTYLSLEKYEEAEAAIVEALDLCDPAGASTRLAASYELMGRIKLIQGKPIEAIPYFTKCYEISRETKVEWYQAFAKRWLAEAMMKLGDRDGAISNLKESIEIFKSTGMTDKLAEATKLLENLETQN